MTRTARLLPWLLFAAALPLTACYVDAGPPGPAYYGPQRTVVYGRGYEWHNYGRPPPPR